jgi:hypothetical protein
MTETWMQVTEYVASNHTKVAFSTFIGRVASRSIRTVWHVFERGAEFRRPGLKKLPLRDGSASGGIPRSTEPDIVLSANEELDPGCL